MSRMFFSVCVALAAMACSGGESPAPDDTDTVAAEPTDTAGDDAPPAERCEGYAPTDGCMNEDNFAECQRVAAQCPGAVQVMESCPLQFGCP